MPTIDVECTECATVLPIEEDELGAEMKCPKCKTIFVAEKSGGAYELAAPPPRQSGKRPGSSPPAGTDLEAEAIPETDAERRLRERMEKWASE